MKTVNELIQRKSDGDFNGCGNGGFIKYEPINIKEKCLNEEHNPPSHISLKPGRHTYECPSCGKITIINIPLITC